MYSYTTINAERNSFITTNINCMQNVGIFLVASQNDQCRNVIPTVSQFVVVLPYIYEFLLCECGNVSICVPCICSYKLYSGQILIHMTNILIKTFLFCLFTVPI